MDILYRLKKKEIGILTLRDFCSAIGGFSLHYGGLDIISGSNNVFIGLIHEFNCKSGYMLKLEGLKPPQEP